MLRAGGLGTAEVNLGANAVQIRSELPIRFGVRAKFVGCLIDLGLEGSHQFVPAVAA
jgi:hypothetical protein